MPFIRYSLLCLLLPLSLAAQNLTAFEEKVTEFTLDNGLHFLIVERHEAPVAAFLTYADVGGADEVKGITGMAHVFEHMAFKGTTTTGAIDLEAEQDALQAVDAAFAALMAERHKGARADPDALAQLTADFEAARLAAQALGNSSEMEKAIDRAGGSGLNATTGADRTLYFYSLPSNKAELWFSLESDRFLNPVLREFYIEKDVVKEERRMRTESSPFGRLLEEFVTTAYKAHPYGEPVIGHMADLETMSRAEAEAFFKTYYGPSNLTIAIVGDVDPAHMRTLAETYFGRLPARPAPAPVETVEPPQIGERRVTIEERSQPLFIMGYHKGNIAHPDDVVFDVIADVMSRGRTSRLYKRLVEQDQIAVQASGFVGYPGNKYPNLMLFYGAPSPGHTAEACLDVIQEEVARLKTEPVAAEELAKAKSRARADLVRQLGSNSGLAIQLATTQVLTGDWRTLFQRLDALEAVTAEDVMRVAKTTFNPNNRTVALVKTVSD